MLFLLKYKVKSPRPFCRPPADRLCIHLKVDPLLWQPSRHSELNQKRNVDFAVAAPSRTSEGNNSIRTESRILAQRLRRRGLLIFHRDFVWNRRDLMKRGLIVSAGVGLARPASVFAETSRVLNVASAGSIRAMLEGPLKDAAAQQLRLSLSVHAGGSDATARSVIDGTVPADVFIPITAGPMLILMGAGKAKVAYPIASTEMVILYSPKSRFAPHFAEASQGKRHWWEVLQEPGLRFARSNPADDPGGRNIIFTVMLAGKIYQRPDLVQQVLGTPLNPGQVQAGVDVRKGLEDGSIDAAGSYRIATRLGQIPYLSLPPEINLSDTHIREKYPDISLTVNEKTFYPEPLFFYAASLEGAKNPGGAQAFVNWLRGKQAAALFMANGFSLPDPSAAVLR